MNRFAIILCLGALAGSSLPAHAQFQHDYVGLFFDRGATLNCALMDGFFDTCDVYLLYLNPTVEEIAGYEIGIELPSGVALVSGSSVCGDYTGDLRAIAIGCSESMSCGPITELLTLHLITIGPIECYGSSHFVIGASSSPSRPIDGPFAIRTDGSVLALTYDCCLAFLDPGCDTCAGLSEERSAWGGVKALYR